MTTGKATRTDVLNDLDEFDSGIQVFETGGQVFPDGLCLELVRPKDDGLRLLASRGNKTAERFKYDGRTYGVPNLHPSILDILNLPTGRAPHGSTRDLLNDVQGLFMDYGFFNEAAELFAYFVLSNWFKQLLLQNDLPENKMILLKKALPHSLQAR